MRELFDPAHEARSARRIPPDRGLGTTTRMLLAALVPVSEHRDVVLLADTLHYADVLKKQLMRMAYALGLTIDQRRILAMTKAAWFDEGASQGRHWEEDDLRIYTDHTAGGLRTTADAYLHAKKLACFRTADLGDFLRRIGVSTL